MNHRPSQPLRLFATQGSRYADAIGFRVWGDNGGLVKMRDIKDNDGEGTLMTFITRCCIEQCPDFDQIFPSEQTDLYKNSSILELKEIMKFITDLAKSLMMMKSVLEEPRMTRGVYHKRLEPFYEHAVKRLASLTQLYAPFFFLLCTHARTCKPSVLLLFLTTGRRRRRTRCLSATSSSRRAR